jgi:hypothetical protein
MALIAVGPAKASNPRRMAPIALSHTQFKGVPVNVLIRWKNGENGNAPGGGTDSDVRVDETSRRDAHRLGQMPKFDGKMQSATTAL